MTLPEPVVELMSESERQQYERVGDNWISVEESPISNTLGYFITREYPCPECGSHTCFVDEGGEALCYTALTRGTMMEGCMATVSSHTYSIMFDAEMDEFRENSTELRYINDERTAGLRYGLNLMEATSGPINNELKREIRNYIRNGTVDSWFEHSQDGEVEMVEVAQYNTLADPQLHQLYRGNVPLPFPVFIEGGGPIVNEPYRVIAPEDAAPKVVDYLEGEAEYAPMQ